MYCIVKRNVLDSLFIALAMSVGWGFRGNYGHEYGAMVPGALVAMAVCLASGREDWYRRVAYFGLFGALGWAFGGQMSYGIVIGYTKSADLISVVYGFGGLFLIGFLWGGIGAGILSLAIIWERKKIVESIFPLLMVFVVWSIFSLFFQIKFGDSEPSIFSYYDTDWLAAATALLALLITAALQRKINHAVSLLLHITIGWLIGLLLFVTLLGWHLSPPRSDNWAGVLGLFIGLLIFLMRHKYWLAVYPALFVAIFGGLGFSTGQLFQVLGDTTGFRMDWWKVMEQSFGFVMGLGVAIVFLRLRQSAPKLENEKVSFDWGNGFAIFFLLVVMSYVNLTKNIDSWLKQGMVEQQLFGLSPHFWFNIGYIILAMLVMIFYQRSQRQQLALIPVSAAGKGQLLFLLILWWAIIGDQFQAFLKFNDAKLIVEGSFYVSAVLLSLWIAVRQVAPFAQPVPAPTEQMKSKIRRVAIWIPVSLILVMIIPAFFARISHTDSLAGSHVRFKKVQQMRMTKQVQEAILLSEFIFDQAPFAECHASTIAETDSGLITAWFGGTEEKDDDVGIWISRNSGFGWTPVVEVADGVQNEKLRYPCWNPVLFQPKNEPLMLFYKVGPDPREWWGMIKTSSDGGKTWSAARRIPDGFLGPIKNKPIQLADGTFLCGSSTESNSAGWLVYIERTDAAAIKWAKTDSLNNKYEFFAIQPAILSYADGQLQILCRSKQKRITECWSSDNGKTWSKMRMTDLPNPDAGIDAVTLKNGGQLLVYNHTTTSRSPLNVAISKDGKAWKSVMVLEDQPGEYSYPAVIQTSDGMVHITYTYKREKIKHVVIDPSKLFLE